MRRESAAIKYLHQLEEAVKNKDFDSRGPLGQRFRRTGTEGLRWAERKYANLKSGKRHTKAWRRVGESKGVYKTLASVAEAFGYKADPESACLAASAYCRKCVHLGGKIRVCNPM